MHESKLNLPVSNRFWDKVEKMENGCWLWRGCLGNDGYGTVNLVMPGHLLSTGRQKQKAVRAHRLAWRLTYGEWPAEFTPDGRKGILLHSCDVRNCVNPAHLRLGSHAENSADAMERGRMSRGDFHSAAVSAHVAKGEAVGTSKLTDEQVAYIKGELLGAPRNEHGELRHGVYPRLAEHFGVTRTTLFDISSGRSWAHIEPAKIEKSILPAVKLTRRNTNMKLTLEQAKEIHRLRALGMTMTDLAKKFDGSISRIWSVLHGRTWPDALVAVAHDPSAPLRTPHYVLGDVHPNSKLSEKAVREIKTRAAGGEPWVNLVVEFTKRCRVNAPAIYDILNEKTWKHVVVTGAPSGQG